MEALATTIDWIIKSLAAEIGITSLVLILFLCGIIYILYRVSRTLWLRTLELEKLLREAEKQAAYSTQEYNKALQEIVFEKKLDESIMDLERRLRGDLKN